MLSKPWGATPIVAGLLLTFIYECALAQIPGTISPGGQRPQETQSAPTQDPRVLSIPPVALRPLDEAEGPKIVVANFDLQMEDTLAAQVDADLLASVNGQLDARLALQPQPGYTIGQLEAVARDITDLFRASGFILAWAYLPVQEVEQGRVEIKVLAGWLDAVMFEGNRRYSVKRLSGPFKDLQGRPVKLDELESAVLNIRDFPGLTPSAMLSPGVNIGSSDLTIQIQESMFDWGTSLDNYGTKASGTTRLRGYMSWNNPLGVGDRFYVELLQTFDPAENTYGNIFYEIPIGQTWSTSLGYSKNDFDVTNFNGQDISAFGLTGDSDIAALAVRKKFFRSRNFNLNAVGSLSLKKAMFEDPRVSLKREDDLSVFSLGIETDIVDNLLGNTGINQMSLFWTIGVDDFLGSMDSDGDCNSTRQGGSSGPCPGGLAFAGGDFNKVVFTLQRMQRISELNSLLLRGLYQWSDDLLVSLEQVSLGGPFNNHAYQVSQALVDKGGYASLEWMFNLSGMKPFNQGVVDITLILFADYSGGRNNDPLLSEEKTTDLSSFGGAFEFGFDIGDGRVYGRLDIATPIGDAIPLNSNDDDDPRFWGRIGISF